MSIDPAKQGKVLKFVNDNPVAVLSTAADNKPWGSPVYVVADELLNFYFVTRSSTAKYKNFKNNPAVALTIVDGQELQAVQLSGEVAELEPGEHRHKLFQELDKVHPEGVGEGWLPPVAELESGTYAMCKVTPRFLQFADFSPGTSSSTGHIEPIIPD